MIDTVSIHLKEKLTFDITESAQFLPEFSMRPLADVTEKELNNLKSKKIHYLRYFKLCPDNPYNIYYPKIEVYESIDLANPRILYQMVITFSIPKLLFRNSLQEVGISDWKNLLNTLEDRLKRVGIKVIQYALTNAIVSVVHFCKNIILPPEISLRSILVELSKVDVGKAYDTTEDRRCKNKNNGEILHLRCDTRETAFYDKISEMKKIKGKDTSGHRTTFEEEILKTYNLENTEVLRYEYRLSKTPTVKSKINKALNRPYDSVVTLKDLFSEGLCKKIILNSWNNIIARPENQIALVSFDSDLELLSYMLKKAKIVKKSGHSLNQMLWSYGLVHLVKKHGVKAIRKEILKVWSSKSNERLNAKFEVAADILKDLKPSDGIAYVGGQLNKFEQITLDSFIKRV